MNSITLNLNMCQNLGDGTIPLEFSNDKTIGQRNRCAGRTGDGSITFLEFMLSASRVLFGSLVWKWLGKYLREMVGIPETYIQLHQIFW